MDRRDKMLFGLDIPNQAGLEIGALDKPLVTRAEGPIRYADYADTAFLRDKYRTDPTVIAARLVEVDAIWGASTMAQATGGQLFDYALASHVVEHVPDLVAWLDELHAVLKPGGTLRLAVPDRRYTFDFLREPSRVSDAIAAHVQRARAPMPSQLIDSCLNHHPVDKRALWEGRMDLAPRYPPRHRLDHAIACARQTMAGGPYIDVHCWVFTPASFLSMLEQLCALGLVHFECVSCFDTVRDHDEFIVVLRKSDDPAACIESWRRAGEALVASQPRPLAHDAALAEAARTLHAAAEARADIRQAEIERRTAPLVWLARRGLAHLRTRMRGRP